MCRFVESKHVPARHTVQFTVRDSSGVNLELGFLLARWRLLSVQQEVFLIFFVTPDGWHFGQDLYKKGVLDISVARASAVTPPEHLTDPAPLYSKLHKNHKGVPRSACCERFAKQVLDQGPWTLVIRASQRFANREPTGRVFIVTDISIAQKGCSIEVSLAKKPEYSTSLLPRGSRSATHDVSMRKCALSLCCQATQSCSKASVST